MDRTKSANFQNSHKMRHKITSSIQPFKLDALRSLAGINSVPPGIKSRLDASTALLAAFSIGKRTAHRIFDRARLYLLLAFLSAREKADKLLRLRPQELSAPQPIFRQARQGLAASLSAVIAARVPASRFRRSLGWPGWHLQPTPLWRIFIGLAVILLVALGLKIFVPFSAPTDSTSPPVALAGPNLRPAQAVVTTPQEAPAFFISVNSDLLSPLSMSESAADPPPPRLSADAFALPADQARLAEWSARERKEDGAPGFARPIGEQLIVDPPYEIISAAVFRNATHNFTLAEVDGLRSSDVCLDNRGLRWACGLQARAFLNNKIRKRVLNCQLARRLITALEEVWCEVEGEDLGAALIEAGWARPIASSPRRYVDAYARAIEAKNGVWVNEWPREPAPNSTLEQQIGIRPD